MTESWGRDTPMRCGPQTRPALSADAKSAQRRRRSRTSPTGHIQTIGAAESQHTPSQSPVKSLRNLESRDWKYSWTKTTRHQGVSQSTTALFNRVTKTGEPATIRIRASERTADRTSKWTWLARAPNGFVGRSVTAASFEVSWNRLCLATVASEVFSL